MSGILLSINRWLFVNGAGCCIFGMSSLIALEILIRALGGQGFVWLIDVTGLILLIFFFMVVPHSWHTDSHVRMDLVYNILPPWLKKCIDGIGLLGAIVFTLAIGLRSALEVEHMYKVGVGSQTISIPHWPFAVAVAVFSMLATLGALASFANPIDKAANSSHLEN
ncbi:MAG: TRAP transporter small permease [Burkholderiaceae bacterium]|jgi:TRAP-type C4-dicarboxylate transport system permease small subunit|nr:TRAP transporter small permease [Betaproteobacteria bacterium]